MPDFRCDNKLHGKLVSEHVLEVKCDSRWCGKLPGNVVLHRFSTITGELIETLSFKTPHQPTEG